MVTVLAPVAVLTGWFWVRNQVIYGDPAASDELLDRFDRNPLVSGFWSFVTRGGILNKRLREILGGTSDIGPGILPRFAAPVFWLLLVVAVVWFLVRLAGGMIRPPRPTGAELRRDAIMRGQLILIVAASLVLPWVFLSRHAISGGGSHSRYLLPALPMAVALIASAIGALPVRFRQATQVATLLGLALLTYQRLTHLKYGIFFLVKDPLAPGLREPLLGDAGRTLVLILAVLGGVVALVTWFAPAIARRLASSTTTAR